MIRRVEAAGFKAVPTGIEHGTVTVVAGGRPFEVTTLREDIETFGRHAKVAFGRDWRRDAERRDFTMNALSASRDGTVHDYVGGLADLAARRVRFIGEPARRIAEDYLRILRFFRFHAAYGRGAPDAGGPGRLHRGARRPRAAVARARPHGADQARCWPSTRCRRSAVMTEAGLLEPVLGGVPLLASFANMVKLEHALALAPDAVRRLGALAVSVVEDAERLRERLRLANAEHERLVSMADALVADFIRAGRAGRRASCSIGSGRERYTDRVLLAWTRAPRRRGRCRAGARSRPCRQRWSAPVFPLKAADFIARGVPKGPRARRRAGGGRGGVDRGRFSARRSAPSLPLRMRRWRRRNSPAYSRTRLLPRLGVTIRPARRVVP